LEIVGIFEILEFVSTLVLYSIEFVSKILSFLCRSG